MIISIVMQKKGIEQRWKMENHSSSFDKVAHIHVVNALPITEKRCNAF